MLETWVRSLGLEDPLEEGMATHSSILAWRSPWTEEPGGPQSMGSQRARHDWGTKSWQLYPWGGVFQNRLHRFTFPEQRTRLPMSACPHWNQLLISSWWHLPWGGRGISPWSWFVFPSGLWCWRSFSCAYWPFVYFRWRNVYSNHLHILKTVFFSCYSVVWVLYKLLGTSPANLFSHLMGLLFTPWMCVSTQLFSRVWLFVTPWTISCQFPLSMEFSKQEYWSGLPCPPAGDLPNPGIKLASLTSPALVGRFFKT